MEAPAQEQSIDSLITAVQRLSLADSIEEVQEVVRTAARELTGADGATIVMRDGEFCFYADEDAIDQGLKGQRFPLEASISGWVMLTRSPAVVEDIDADERFPFQADRPTSVRSLAMVPIRSLDPIGAIGNYWAERHRPTPLEVSLLQSLADATAVAIDNVSLAGGAHVDDLTGVATRRGFFVEAGNRFASARARDRQCTVAFADVDGLKQVNDRAGHDAGSALISDAARILVDMAGPEAVVGRLGGDEFAIYLDGVADPEELRARLTALCDQANADGREPRVSISFGAITAWAEAAESLDRVIAAADMTMYLDKRNRTERDPSDPGKVRRTPRRTG